MDASIAGEATLTNASHPTAAKAATASAGGALARVIAFYLPQFHPTPENDLWWGAGFTEWTNVAKAKPLFPGHVQPRLPADLGFYDLRVPEVREQQADLARKAGVESFCYWHYWFGNGRRILDRPFAEVLASGKPDFPFCLAWANQTWTGIWHGAAGRTLIEQTYPGKADEKAHFEWARSAFEDPRHTLVDGKPVFVIYSPGDMPSTTSFVEHWRELAQKAGYPGIYFVGVSDVHDGTDPYHVPRLECFDAVTLLGPQDYLSSRDYVARWTLGRRLKEHNLGNRFNRFRPKSWLRPSRVDYADVIDHLYLDMPPGERFLPSVLAGWDNTPRSSVRGVVYENSTPEQFSRYVAKALDRVKDYPSSQRIIFLKAWNEWAEGNIMEPDSVHGHGFMNALREAVLPAGVDGQDRSSDPKR